MIKPASQNQWGKERLLNKHVGITEPQENR